MKKMKLNIVLVEPEIPQNTGNIARTCAALGAKLHLVYPLWFSISEKQVKRAGLDYWDKLEIEEHLNFEKFLEKYKPEENNMFFVTTKESRFTLILIIQKWMKFLCFLEKKQKVFQKMCFKNILKKQWESQWEHICVHWIYQIPLQ